MIAWLDTMIMGLWLGIGIGCGAIITCLIAVLVFRVYEELMKARGK